MIDFFYSDTKEQVKIGDHVLIDTCSGIVKGVFLKETKEAEECGCEDTGALSITTDDGNPVLFPFGGYLTVFKRQTGSQVKDQ